MMIELKEGNKVDAIQRDLQLSALKPLHVGWLVPAFQNVKEETLKRMG